MPLSQRLSLKPILWILLGVCVYPTCTPCGIHKSGKGGCISTAKWLAVALIVFLTLSANKQLHKQTSAITGKTQAQAGFHIQTPIAHAAESAPVVQPTPAPVEQPKPIPQSNEEMMIAAGISPSDFTYATYIFQKESGFRHTAVNKSSGATGICQALPASKMASAGADYMTNPVTQLRWCNGYAIGRYGSWANAYNFWTRNHWW